MDKDKFKALLEVFKNASYDVGYGTAMLEVIGDNSCRNFITESEVAQLGSLDELIEMLEEDNHG